MSAVSLFETNMVPFLNDPTCFTSSICYLLELLNDLFF